MSTPTPEPLGSPLAEAKPMSLDEIFSSDPRDLKPPEIDVAVAAMRKMREAWTQEQALGKKSAPRAARALKQSAEGVTKLEDLFGSEIK